MNRLKMGKDLSEAILAEPKNFAQQYCAKFAEVPKLGVKVLHGQSWMK